MKIVLITSVLASKEKLASILVGTFHSSVQSIYNPSYFDVTVHHCQVKVSKPDMNAIYLAVEQRISLNPVPYRTRLMELTEQNGQVVSTVYRPLNETFLVGVCSKPDVVIDLDQFSTNDKCPVYLDTVGDGFKGKTGPQGCKPSTGSGYVTSEADIHPSYMKTWDRGFGNNNVQTWGAREGPYQFQKVDATLLNPYQSEFASYVIGEFDNAEQVALDSIKYPPVKIKQCPIRAQGFASSSVTLFLEETIALPTGPFIRRGIVEIQKGPGHDTIVATHKLASSVESQFANFCDNFDINKVVPESNIVKSNCKMNFLPRDLEKGLEFYGITPVGGCESDFKGSSVLTVLQIIGDGNLNYNERWWNTEGKTVAGNPGDGDFNIYKRTKLYKFPIDIAILG